MNLKTIGFLLALLGFGLTQAQGIVEDKKQNELIEKKVKEELAKQREEA